MATRIYLPNTGATDINPTFGTWTETTGADRIKAVTTRISSVMTSKTQAHAATAANSTYLSRQYVIGPLAGQTYAASTIKGTIRVLESAVNDNLDAMRLLVRVFAPDASTVRGTIYGPTNGTVLEFNTTLRAKRLATGGATTQVVITEGDYLVIDIGTTNTTIGASLSDSISYGDDNATDLGDNETDTTALNPFVELAGNMLFLGRGFGQANADIKAIGRGFGQANAQVWDRKPHAQADALINGSFFLPFSDTFTRTVSPGMGTSDNTDVWAVSAFSGAPASDVSVNGSQLIAISDSSGASLLELNKTLIKSPAGYEFAIQASIDKIPSTATFVAQFGVGQYSSNQHFSLSVVVTPTQIQASLGTDQAGAPQSAVLSVVAGTTYNLKGHFLPAFGNSGFPVTYGRLKIWAVGDPEPDWTDGGTIAALGLSLPGHPRVNVGTSTDANAPFTLTLDNFTIKEAHWTYTGQAQAKIKAIAVKGYGQAQADIKKTTRGFAQAAALVNGSFFLPFSDTFTRTVVDSLGTSDNTDTWTLISGTTANFDVDGSKATAVTTTAAYQHWGLKRTLALSSTGYEISGQFSLNKIPATNSVGLVLGFNFYGDLSGITAAVQVIVNFNNTVFNSIQIGGTSTSGSSFAYAAGETWNTKLHILPAFDASGVSTYFRSKLWKVGNAEPGWEESSGALVSGFPLPQPIYLNISSDNSDANTPFTWTLDNFSIKAAHWTYSGQANADIKAVNSTFGQAQADIKATGNVFAQSQADIKAVGNGLGQSNADIKAVNSGFAQANTNIKAVNSIFGQANADIKAVNRGFAQAQTDIKAVGSKVGLAKAFISGITNYPSDTFTRTVSNGFGAADAGGDYTILNGAASAFAVDGSKATLTGLDLTTNGSRYISLLRASHPLNAEVSVNFSFSTLPTGNEYLSLVLYQGENDTNPDTLLSAPPPGTGGTVNYQTNGNIRATGQVDGAEGNFPQDVAYIAGDIYTLKFRTWRYSTKVLTQAKTWKTGTAEPEYPNDGETTSINLEQGHISFQGVAQLNHIITLDNFIVEDAHFRAGGQAQACIRGNVFGQSQANIKAIGNRFGQANAYMLNGHAHAQAMSLIDTGIYASSDAFSRTTSNGNGTADVGGAWSSTSVKVSTDGSEAVYSGTVAVDNDLKSVTSKPVTEVRTDFLVHDWGNNTGQTTLYLAAHHGVSSTLNGASLLLNHSTQITDVSARRGGGGVSGGTSPVVIDTWYTLIAHVNAADTLRGTNKVRIRVKFGLTSTIDSTGWLLDTDTSTGNPELLAYPGININGANATAKIWLDNWSTQPIGWTESGQAQAKITAVAFTAGYGQAQADIKAVNNGFGQSQADIKAVGNGFGQAQADIKATGNGFAQSNADIKATSNSFAQSQADIKAITSQPAQSQADIKATTNVFAQSQADIKAVGYGLAQAQADIKAVGTGFAQSNADIKAVTLVFAQAQADILVTSNKFAQSQADIKAVSNGLGQAQAKMNAFKVNGFGQANADIKTTGQGCGQAQAIVSRNTQGCAQAQADIKATSQVYAQAQSDIKAIGYGSGQSQADTRAITYQSANAQADIKVTGNSYGQAQGDIKQTYNGFAQAQAEIRATINQSAQSQAYIKLIQFGFAQAQAKILKSAGYGLARAYIRQPHELKSLTISDRHSMNISLEDRVNPVLDNKISLALSDRTSINIDLDDREY